jgi:hypothetical protein
MVGHREAHEARPIQVLVWVAMALVLADVIAYLLLIRFQGDFPPDAFTVPFVAGYMLLMAIVLWLSLFDGPRLVVLRPALRACAAAGLLVLGVLGLFSIGLPLGVAGVLAMVAAIGALAGPHLRRAALSEIAAALIAVIVLAGGFELTQRWILCPPSGTMSGSGYGLIGGGYHYECVNGRLTYSAGECNSGTQGVDANGNAFATSNC